MIKPRTLFVCTLALAWPLVSSPARAEMYKYVDERGRVTYSNKPIKGGHKVELPELSTMPAPKLPPPKTVTPESNDRENRRQALQAQITQEEKALADAKDVEAIQAVLDKPAFDQLLDDSPRLAARILKGALHRMLPVDAA